MEVVLSMAPVMLELTGVDRPLLGIGSADELTGAIIHASESLEQ